MEWPSLKLSSFSPVRLFFPLFRPVASSRSTHLSPPPPFGPFSTESGGQTSDGGSKQGTFNFPFSILKIEPRPDEPLLVPPLLSSSFLLLVSLLGCHRRRQLRRSCRYETPHSIQGNSPIFPFYAGLFVARTQRTPLLFRSTRPATLSFFSFFRCQASWEPGDLEEEELVDPRAAAC